ncbi:MAG: HIT family protein [Gammaproteobacteria bacterium]|nr:HIT family protein [Gammaproteobacteria bacterium]
MPNQTIIRFGHPASLIREYEHWVVLLREQQVTLGSLVLCAKSDVTAFSELPTGVFEEMGTVVRDIERTLNTVVNYEKINYLMLMMVDPNVHFHVFPRYAAERSACGLTISDHGWPGPPKLKEPRELTPAERDVLCKHIIGYW